jgi:hypothetical protein
MKKNIHDYERIGRVVGGAALASLAFWGPRKAGFLAFLVPVATGAVGTCPLYSALGISTRPNAASGNTSIGKGGRRDNDYFPVQSASESAAGHPIVGVV